MAFAAAAALALQSQDSRADENGVSLWLPGQFGSLAAAPAVPGWSLGVVGYHTSVSASGNVAAAREISIGQVPRTASVNLNANLDASGNLMFISPTYTFATPVLGGQLAVSVIGAVGHLDTSIAGTLTAQAGPIVATRNGFISDSLTGFGDLYPLVTLKWNQGVHNYMVYGFGDIPVGAYDSTRLSNIGIGHGGIDFGAGYTYLNPMTGIEFSGVGGFTYNFKNTTTQYQNGIDFHFDWGASHWLSKQLFVGMVGYAYQQITDDFGAAPFQGGFQIARVRLRPPARLSLSDWRQAGISEPQGLPGVCRRKPPRGLERLADLRDLECRADIDGCANAAYDYEVALKPRNARRPVIGCGCGCEAKLNSAFDAAVKPCAVRHENCCCRSQTRCRYRQSRRCPIFGTASVAIAKLCPKLKTSGRALPEVSEVYHKVALRLLETKRPSKDLAAT